MSASIYLIGVAFLALAYLLTDGPPVKPVPYETVDEYAGRCKRDMARQLAGVFFGAGGVLILLVDLWFRIYPRGV